MRQVVTLVGICWVVMLQSASAQSPHHSMASQYGTYSMLGDSGLADEVYGLDDTLVSIAPTTGSLASVPVNTSRRTPLFEELSFLLAVDGSKQPQDFGVNAHAGAQASMNWGIPLLEQYGLGAQVGTGITATSNAVRVYELLGETTGRTQYFTTVGLFQRFDRFSWGFTHDLLYQEYFDDFFLGQWRLRGAYDLSTRDQIGITSMLKSRSDTGTFGSSTEVTLEPITQGHIYWRRIWKSGAQTTGWLGLAAGHGEDNAVTGYSPPKDEVMLFGADVLVPLNDSLAIYGETNLILPNDTGTVDAFLGIQWYPSGNAYRARRGQYSPLMTLASPVSFAVDLFRSD